MKRSSVSAGLPITIAILISGSWFAYGGNLNPPAGPVAGTMKPLTEIEPRIALNATNTPGDADSVFRIASPGSYYLTSNVVVENDKSGIEIAASSVTIDLMGFTLQAAPGSPGAQTGIYTEGIQDNLTIRNGIIKDFFGPGIDLLLGGIGRGSLVEQIQVSNNTGLGILVNTNSVVRSCTVEGNSAGGMYVSRNGTIESCAARENGGTGIIAGPGTTITNCSSSNNGTNGINAVEYGCTITGCSAYSNGFIGINTFGASTITGCSAYLNGGNGITGFGSVFTGCSADSNLGSGISAGDASTITGCTASFNSFDGVLIANDCSVLGNTCDSNGNGGTIGAGVHATGGDNRIEDNNCTDNDRGIDIDAAGNLIIRNSASNNPTNYDIVADNRYGPIIDITAGGTPAVSGNSAADTSGTTHPWANFAY